MSARRNAEIALRYREGDTLDDIASSQTPPITRQRVYSILSQRKDFADLRNAHYLAVQSQIRERKMAVCPVCRKRFLKSSHMRVYCGEDCRQKARYGETPAEREVRLHFEGKAKDD